MTERAGRFVLLLAALVLTASLYNTGRDVPGKEDIAAFLPEGAEGIGTQTIGIRGNAARSGIFQFRRPGDLLTVINMTVSPEARALLDMRLLPGRLRSGETVNVSIKNDDHIEITIEKMKVGEKIVLGIPLDPNDLTESDWEKLPGIGRTTARSIMADRQLNGDFSSLGELKRVPGIGDARLRQLKRYLKH